MWRVTYRLIGIWPVPSTLVQGRSRLDKLGVKGSSQMAPVRKGPLQGRLRWPTSTQKTAS